MLWGWVLWYCHGIPRTGTPYIFTVTLYNGSIHWYPAPHCDYRWERGPVSLQYASNYWSLVASDTCTRHVDVEILRYNLYWYITLSTKLRCIPAQWSQSSSPCPYLAHPSLPLQQHLMEKFTLQGKTSTQLTMSLTPYLTWHTQVLSQRATTYFTFLSWHLTWPDLLITYTCLHLLHRTRHTTWLTSLSLLSSSGVLSVAIEPCFSTSIIPLVALEFDGSSLIKTNPRKHQSVEKWPNKIKIIEVYAKEIMS